MDKDVTVMKVAISARGKTLDSLIDERFGRARFIVLVETDGESLLAAVDNVQNLNASQGAGIQAAQTVSRQGAKAVVTGHCGPKAFQALSAAGIAVYTGASGTVQQAVAAFASGQLKPAEAPDVAGHWA
jgi:predicted Fe-Mo cluster-binding NifX family protein